MTRINHHNTRLNRRKVRRLYNEQKGRCWYCGVMCRLNENGQTWQYPNSATLEHLRNHKLDTFTLVMACYDCNLGKSHISNKLRKGEYNACQDQYDGY